VPLRPPEGKGAEGEEQEAAAGAGAQHVAAGDESVDGLVGGILRLMALVGGKERRQSSSFALQGAKQSSLTRLVRCRIKPIHTQICIGVPTSWAQCLP